MEDRLTCSSITQLGDHDAGRIQSFLHGSRHGLSCTNRSNQNLRFYVEEIPAGAARNHECVPFHLGHQVHERDRMFVFVYRRRRRFTAEYPGEGIVVVIVHAERSLDSEGLSI